MSALTELTQKLSEIFQIDRADLDFGIYRILNSRNEQIAHYLNQTLPNTVADKLAQNSDMETAVYRHLLTFFSRYYEEGDFISQRRYKGDTYAIPYNGEEVVLHWANKDQYYTKSGENFANYRFKLSDGREVFFKLNQADTAKDNQKDNEAKRFFTLANPQIDDNENVILPINQSDDGQILTILFDYKAFPKSAKPTQDKILADDLATIFANEIVATNWQALTENNPTQKNKERTLLEKHLSDYTAKNTADYFIHKDLGGFLKRELDFYIKNEVMNLDDIDNAQTADNIAQNLRLIQTLRAIAFDIIVFLAQLENFQKRLWEKKKFVADCHYLITLDNIDEKFHEEIFANQKQLDEWQKLYQLPSVTPPPDNPHLVVNTSLFDKSFQAKLLATFDDLDNQINGTIIHSDNFQALNLLQAKYQGQVKCIYIDPPYNANSSLILYKNTYKHSSWISLMENRMLMGKDLLNSNGSQAVAIDEIEQEVLGQTISSVFSNWQKACIPIVHNPRGQQGKNISYVHEYFFLIYPNDNQKFISDVKRNEVDSRNLRDSGTESDRTDAKNCFYPFYIQDNEIIGFGEIPNDDYHPISANVEIKSGRIKLCPANTKDYKFIDFIIDKPIIAVYPMTDSGDEKKWRYSNQSVKSILAKLEPKKTRANIQIIFHKDTGVMRSLWVDTKYDASEYGTKVLQSILGLEEAKKFSYPKSIHTVTQIIDAQIGLDNNNALTLDYFAGSGTTAHAVINLNREDGGNRKFILVEQGEYFDTVLKPRIQKVIFAKEYKDGKPVADKDGQFGGISQIVKVLKLESYEDTLNNLVLQQSDLFDRLPEITQNDYLLNYMLAIESRESLLNVADFARPFDYELNISANSAGAFVRQKIDLVETFNYLIGATVLGIDDRRDSKGYVEIECRLPRQNDDERTLIFWRDCTKLGYDELKAMFVARHINPKESTYQEIYINGDHTLDTVWESADGIQSTLKVKSIEQEFLTLMFGAI